MIITLTRTGGFTGIPSKKTIDTEKLQPDKTKQIAKLVQTSNFFTLTPEVKTSSGNPDHFTYNISIEDTAISHTVSMNEKSLTPPLKDLVSCLENI